MTLFEKALINDTKAFNNDNYDINLQDSDGRSLLHYAVLGSAYELVDLLIKKGANVNITNSDGESPIFDCARKAKLELAKKLISQYAKLNITNNKGEGLLHLAAAKGNKKFIQLLIENKINTKVLTNDFIYPVHYAIISGQIDVIKYILNISNQSFSLLDKSNNTLLHYAARTTNDLLIYFLISEGINPNFLNNNYETALFNAVRFGTKETIHALLANDSYINIKNIHGEDPVDIANIYSKYTLETVLNNYQMLPRYERLIQHQSLSVAVLNRDTATLMSCLANNKTMRLDKYNYSALDYAKLYNFDQAASALKTTPLI